MSESPHCVILNNKDAAAPEGFGEQSSANHSELLPQLPSEKFGIVNHNDVNSEQTDCEGTSFDACKRTLRSSVCSSVSESSTMGSYRQLTSPSAENQLLPLQSISSDAKDSSDQEGWKPNEDTTYRMLRNDSELQYEGVGSNSSLNMSHGGTNRLSSPVSTSSQHSHGWITFDGPNGVACKSSTIKKSLNCDVNKPPEIPSRKFDLINPSTPNTIDLLSMDNDVLSKVLSETEDHTGNDARLQSKTPPIPERVLSPKRATQASPMSSGFEVRIPPPHAPSPGGSLKRRSLSRNLSATSSSSTSASGIVSLQQVPPTVPPRKDFLHAASSPLNSIMSIHGRVLEGEVTPPAYWAGYTAEHKLLVKDSLVDSMLLDTSNSLVNLPTNEVERPPSVVLSPAITDVLAQLDMESESQQEKNDDSMWNITMSALESPKSKKRKGGYQHLPSDSDEEVVKNEENFEELNISIRVTDLSPCKPLSRWAPIPSHDLAASSADASDVGRGSDDNESVDGGMSHDDVDLDLSIDDDFDNSINRLSTELSELKGFNRDDKGSQNNLVDFSSEREARNLAATIDCDDDDVETIFDVAARCNSLRRRQTTTDDCIEEQTTAPGATQPTNPFWSCGATGGETASLASSVGELSPFEKVNFQSTAAPLDSTLSPAPVTSKLAPFITAPIPTIPPPPASGKHLPRSARRSRVHSSVSSTPGGAVDAAGARRSLTFAEDVITVDVSPVPMAPHPPTEAVPASNTEADVTNQLWDDPEASPNVVDATLSLLDIPAPASDDDDQMSHGNSVTAMSHVNTSVNNNLVPVAPPISSLSALARFRKELSVESVDALAGDNGAAPCLQVKKPVQVGFEPMIVPATRWEMKMRFPRVKRSLMRSKRKWVDVCVRINLAKTERPVLELCHNSSASEPFFALQLGRNDWQTTQPKLQADNRRRRGVHPNHQLHDDENRWSSKLHSIKFLRVRYKEKYSFMRKQDRMLFRAPVGFKHSLRGRQLCKLATDSYSDLLSLLLTVEDAAFNANKFVASKDDVTTTMTSQCRYHSRDEIVFDVRDQFRGVVLVDGSVDTCQVTVRVFVTSFLSGADAQVTVGFNDVQIRGREVVGRDEVIPSSNSEWIDVYDVTMHRCCSTYERGSVTFRPLDACRFELMRFNVACHEPRLPITVRPSCHVTGSRVTLRCVLRSSSGHSSNKDSLTQVPCEDVAIRFPVPAAWTCAFQRHTHFTHRVKSLRSQRRNSQRRHPHPPAAVLEASQGGAKYEPAHNALVWRLSRFPEKNAAQNTPHVLTCQLDLTSSSSSLPVTSSAASGDVIRCEVEYAMPSATASSCCVRSVNLKPRPADKFACYSAHYLYKVAVTLSSDEEDTTSQCRVQ